jgi:hypothetical protein
MTKKSVAGVKDLLCQLSLIEQLTRYDIRKVNVMATFRVRTLNAILIASMIAIFIQPSSRADDDLFTKYPVKVTFHGHPVAPVLTTPDEHLFRTKIREGAAQGAVFADHYGIAIWGCGSGCLQFAIVDSINGQVYIFPYSVSANREIGERLTYHRNSRAVHIIGSLNEENSADRWYLWDGRQLNLIQEKPAKLVDDPTRLQ